MRERIAENNVEHIKKAANKEEYNEAENFRHRSAA
jgi:hypothetical protein